MNPENWTTHIIMNNPSGTSCDTGNFYLDSFSTNNVPPGSNIVVVGNGQILDPYTGITYEYPTAYISQTPFTYEDATDKAIPMNQSLGLPTVPIDICYLVESYAPKYPSLTLLEYGAIFIALNCSDPFVWINPSQDQIRTVLNSLGINYGFRKYI